VVQKKKKKKTARWQICILDERYFIPELPKPVANKKCVLVALLYAATTYSQLI
jgi:hypothetical protein